MDGPSLSPTVTSADSGGCQPLSGPLTGMTIKDILEKVDLANSGSFPSNDVATPQNGAVQDKKPVFLQPNSTPETAFLGPKLWKNPITTLPEMLGQTQSHQRQQAEPTASGANAEFMSAEFMNIDDFLLENDFSSQGSTCPPVATPVAVPTELVPHPPPPALPSSSSAINPPPLHFRQMSSGSVSSDDSSAAAYKPAQSITLPTGGVANRCGRPAKNALKKGESNGFLYTDSKQIKIEREQKELQDLNMPPNLFTPEDLALATIPGADFDPKRRQFSAEELKPQPIIRKRKKTFVNGEDKDDKYWERRGKNNTAARRSREARRLKENQIALRTAYLERENSALQVALDKSSAENERLMEEGKRLREQLEVYKKEEALITSIISDHQANSK